MPLLKYETIPGLMVEREFLSVAACEEFVRDSLNLYERLEQSAGDKEETQRAEIPQPEFVRSEYHNLPSEEYYTRVKLEEENARRLGCEYFPTYGEEGHALCYFRGNSNLPDFVRDALVPAVSELLTTANLMEPEQEYTWRLTMNFYRNLGGTVAGFPFHVDIPANGVVTMIFNIHREALFQITNGEELTDITLPVGSLLILSEESRYDWKHRVLPSPSTQALAPGEVERVSLVLGFQ